jgi:hypothetical protein
MAPASHQLYFGGIGVRASLPGESTDESSAVQASLQPLVNFSLYPETTNMKLVAR